MTLTRRDGRRDADSTVENNWSDELPESLSELQPTCTTTPPPISEYIARSVDGDFYSVHWDCIQNLYRIEQVSEHYAESALTPTLGYRGVEHFLELFGDAPKGSSGSTASSIEPQRDLTERLERIERKLDSFSRPKPEKYFYSTGEAAERLALSKWYVRRQCATGEILAEKHPQSGKFLISADEIERIESRRDALKD